MTEFKSNPVVIESSDRDLFTFLGDFNNFEKLLPEQVINWESTKDNCSFTIKGMADLAMKMGQNIEFSKITYESEGNSPFPFQLGFGITPDSGNQCIVHATLEAKLNPMLKMMASRPLQNFVNLLVEKLKEIMVAR